MEHLGVTLNFWSSSSTVSPSTPPLLSTLSTTTCITSTISAFCISFRINISYHWHRPFKWDILQSSGSDRSFFLLQTTQKTWASTLNENILLKFHTAWFVCQDCIESRILKGYLQKYSARWWESSCLQKKALQLQCRLVEPALLRYRLCRRGAVSGLVWTEKSSIPQWDSYHETAFRRATQLSVVWNSAGLANPLESGCLQTKLHNCSGGPTWGCLNS